MNIRTEEASQKKVANYQGLLFLQTHKKFILKKKSL